MNTIDTLRHAATAYDRRRSKSKNYNIYALAQYLTRLDACAECVAAGQSWREALVQGFNDRLRDSLLNALGEAPTSITECENANVRSIRAFASAI